MHRLPLPMVATLLAAATAWAQVPAGGEFRVNTYTTDSQDLDGVALDGSGRFVVTWSGHAQASPFFDVFAQRHDPAGARTGDEFLVNTTTGGASLSHALFIRGGRQSVVVWNGPGSPGFDIYAQRYGRTGQPVGGEFHVNTYTGGNEYRPDVAALPGGGFVVVWSAHPIQAGSNRIVARLFDANGTPRSPEINVAGPTNGGTTHPTVASAPDGRFVVVWKGTVNLAGRRFDGSGSPQGAEFQVNETFGGLTFAFPRAAMASDGAFVAVWEHPTGDGSGYGVRGRRFTATAAPLGSEFTANAGTLGAQREPSVAMDRTGDFVVSWESNGGGTFDVFARRFSPSGQPRGAEFRVNTYLTAGQVISQVAGDEAGNFVVAWSSGGQDGDGYGVYAQRFGGLLPASASPDAAPSNQSDGNRVLEPGEVVDFRPSWRNLNGAPQAFTGTLSAFTGPAATYTIVDGTGDYGTVANGSTGGCADCYQLGVSAPLPRPVAHWDAEVRESLAPDAQGQVKVWKLHLGDSFTDVSRASPYYHFV